jgi:glycosyltransferase involved in cell wall biosynthesis
MDAMAPFSIESGPDRATHIAILVHSLSRGGAQRRLVTLANAFAEASREVDFVALRRDGDIDQLLDARVRLTILTDAPKRPWKPWFLEGWGKLEGWIARNRPGVVVAGSTAVHFTAVVACKRSRNRPLLVLRASRHPVRYFPWSRPHKRMGEPIQRWARRRLYDAADLVLAVSRETAESLRSGMARPERCVEVANPVLTPAFLDSLGSAPPHPWLADHVPVILAVGRLAREKRFDILLDAFAIARRARDLRLIILGEGYLRDRLEAQARQLGLSDAVCMPGNVAGVGAWMAHADLLVSTSAFEGSPGALIEALAAGLPVVATRCPGGSAELLEDGAGGILIPMRDPVATAAAILAETGRPRDREAMRRGVLKYSQGASATAHLEALDVLASDRSPPAPEPGVAPAARISSWTRN